MKAVELQAVTRRYGERRALDGIDLAVEPGERLAVVGPNGAGKTTLLRLLATLVRPTAGTVRLLGAEPRRAGVTLRRQIGYAGHHTLLYDDLTVRENLAYYGRLYGVEDTAARVEVLLAWAELRGRADDRVGTLSRGLQQRVALARAALHQPRLLLLDEPDTALDGTGVGRLAALMADLAAAGAAVVWSSHDLGRALSVSDRVIVLARGRVALERAAREIVPAEWPALYRRAVGAGD